jgi:hypothetical protein
MSPAMSIASKSETPRIDEEASDPEPRRPRPRDVGRHRQ